MEAGIEKLNMKLLFKKELDIMNLTPFYVPKYT